MVDSVPVNNATRTVMYSRTQYGPTTTSPPAPVFRADIFGQPSVAGVSHYYSNPSPTAERHPTDRNGAMPHLSASTSDPLAFATDSRIPPAIMIRKLPLGMGAAGLRGMLLFSNELIDTEFVRSNHPDDQGFLVAIARFQTPAGAFEAIQKLNGKPNTAQDANMVVEPYRGNAVSAFDRRNTIDGTASRAQTGSASSSGSIGAPSGSLRFNSAFQPPERVSPPLPTPNPTGNGEYPVPGNSQHFQKLFSPQSPLSNGVDGHHRVSGKSMINDDSVDDETGELLKDPVAYAKSGQQSMARRATNPQIPLGRFSSLSLTTVNGASNGIINNGYTSPPPRGHPVQQTTSPIAQAHTPTASANSTYLPNFPRAQYPPVNPADQNPPCNTLYVGNLPIDTNEDELKTLFSKVRGYKRLCFRTKHNGPMCFVEFEDTSFATKALHELYGHPLHNSIKGGIRLSFSKNPLGVRAGQTSGLGPSAVMSPQAMAPGYAGMATNGNYSSVSGPPPGLGTSATVVNGNTYRPPLPVSTGMDGMFSTPFHVPHQGNHVAQAPPRNYSGGVPPIMGNGTYGRDARHVQPRADYAEARNGYGDLRGGYTDLQNGYTDSRNGFAGYDYI